MVIFVSLKKLVKTFWWLIAAVALYGFYKTIGLSLFFLLVLGILALRFVPVLFLPILLIAIGVYFSGGFSFIADSIVLGFWGLVLLPICYACLQSNPSYLKRRKNEKK
ncbi:hypothetical protein ACR3IL_10065 [Streptococcus iniae]|nr:hypothetical protein BKX95_10615 [Streptococcus iniae]